MKTIWCDDPQTTSLTIANTFKEQYATPRVYNARNWWAILLIAPKENAKLLCQKLHKCNARNVPADVRELTSEILLFKRL